MKKYYTLFLLIILLTNCKGLLKSINGEKKSTNETIESLQLYLEKNKFNIDLKKSLFLKDGKTIDLLSTYYKYYYLKHNPKQPYVFLFNKDHKQVDDEILGGCVMERPMTDLNFYDALLVKNDVIDRNELQVFYNSFLDINGEPIQHPFEKNKPVLLIVWSKFRGEKITKPFLKETQRTLINKNPELQVFYLNIDKVYFE